MIGNEKPKEWIFFTTKQNAHLASGMITVREALVKQCSVISEACASRQTDCGASELLYLSLAIQLTNYLSFPSAAVSFFRYKIGIMAIFIHLYSTCVECLLQATRSLEPRK